MTNPVYWTEWVRLNDLASNSPTHDSDGDGLADIYEFFLGRNPWIPDAVMPLHLQRDDSDFVLGFDWLADRAGALLVIEKSSFLDDRQDAGDDLFWLSDAPLGNGRYHRTYRI